MTGSLFLGAGILIGLFEKRFHTNVFLDFRATIFLVFTSHCKLMLRWNEIHQRL